MYETTYHRATSVSDALAKLGAAEDGKFLAGGQTLLPTMKQRLAAPSDVIDVTRIDDMKGITETGSGLRIGAATTHAEVATSEIVKRLLPGLASLAGHIGDPHVRHRGTIGGSVANNDPAADYPPLSWRLGQRSTPTSARFRQASSSPECSRPRSTRTRSSPRSPSPPPTHVPMPSTPTRRRDMPWPVSFVARMADGVRVAVTGAGQDGVFRHEGLEAALADNFSVDAVTGVAIDAGNLLADIHGSAEYRANLVSVMAKRAVAACG